MKKENISCSIFVFLYLPRPVLFSGVHHPGKSVLITVYVES